MKDKRLEVLRKLNENLFELIELANQDDNFNETLYGLQIFERSLDEIALDIKSFLTPFENDEGILIENPFLDETGQFEVNPIEYYVKGEF